MLFCLHVFLFALPLACSQLSGAGFGANTGGGGMPGLLGAASSPEARQAALQDAVEGIGGLMQRFEQIQPQLNTLPRVDLEIIARDGQQLHGRFIELQEKMRIAGGGVPASDEQSVIQFHRDLALFVARTEGKLGIMGPVPPLQAAQTSQAPSGFVGASSFDARSQGHAAGHAEAAAGSARQTTSDRLQAAGQGIVSGMQRFEALHPKLQTLPPQVFRDIAQRGQKLHEDFVVLQRKGAELSERGGQPVQMSDADGLQYAAQLEAFLKEQTVFVQDAEAKVQSSPLSGGGLGGLPPAGGLNPAGGLPHAGGMRSATGLPPASGFASAAGFASAGRQVPPAGLSPNGNLGASASAAGTGGQVTPATDQRLSAVISKVVANMQEFESMKPQLSRTPQQVFNQIAQQGQALNDRFVMLQKQGESIAGDGTRGMLEQDAAAFATAMEAFFNDQSAFVESAKQAVQQSAGGLGGANLGSASLGSGGFGLGQGSFGAGSTGSSFGAAASAAGMGSSSFAGGASAFSGSSFGAPAASGNGGFGGFAQAGPSPTGNSFGGASFGASSFGAAGFGGANTGGPSLGANSFGGGMGGAGIGTGGFGRPSFGGA